MILTSPEPSPLLTSPFTLPHTDKLMPLSRWMVLFASLLLMWSVSPSRKLSALAGDCDPQIPWAREALGCLPGVVNMWICNRLSTTSFRKEYYENLCAVVTGRKHFLLLPPTDVHRMYIRDYPSPSAQYSYSHDTGEFTLELAKPDRYVPWCSVNPYPPPEDRDKQLSNSPLYFDGPKPFHCTLNPGEILYLKVSASIFALICFFFRSFGYVHMIGLQSLQFCTIPAILIAYFDA